MEWWLVVEGSELQVELGTFAFRLDVASVLHMCVALTLRLEELEPPLPDLRRHRLVVRQLALRERSGLKTRKVLHHEGRRRVLQFGPSSFGRRPCTLEVRMYDRGAFGLAA